MRITTLLIALGAVLALPAIPLNTISVLTPLPDLKMLNATTATHTTGVIPVKETKCLFDEMSEDYYHAAKAKLIKWSEDGNKLGPNKIHSEKYPDDVHGVTWYVCNCKLIHRDSIPREELNDVECILGEECGAYHGGWVWSKKWQKRFHVVPTE
jgi:hypothetical protein